MIERVTFVSVAFAFEVILYGPFTADVHSMNLILKLQSNNCNLLQFSNDIRLIRNFVGYDVTMAFFD